MLKSAGHLFQSKFVNSISTIGQYILFVDLILTTARKNPPSRKEVLEQIWKTTTQSLPTTAMAGFFVGAIMSVQFSLQLNEFGALAYLGGLATSGTVRELGPLLIAFMLSGKVGAYTSAELGTMQVTEQMDAVRCLGADPIKEIISPRFFAIIISSVFLLILGLLMSIAGGSLIANLLNGVSPEEYNRYIPIIVRPLSLITGLIKCLVFAIILATICCYKGYTTRGGAVGVGQSVVSTSVYTMVLVVFFDWFTSQTLELILSKALELS